MKSNDSIIKGIHQGLKIGGCMSWKSLRFDEVVDSATFEDRVTLFMWDKEGKISQIVADRFDPDKSNIFNWVYYTSYEVFWKSRHVRILTSSSDQPVYLNIDNYCHFMGIEASDFRENFRKSQLFGHDFVLLQQLMIQLQIPLKKYKKIQQFFDFINYNYFTELARRFNDLDYQDRIDFSFSIIKIAKALANKKNDYQESFEKFRCIFQNSLIEYKFVDEEKIDLYELKKYGMKSLHLKEQEKDQIQSIIKIGSTITKKKDLVIGEPLIKLFQVEKLPIQTENLTEVLKIIDENNLIKIAEEFFKEDTRRFLNTLLKIGSCFRKQQGFFQSLTVKELYYKKETEGRYAFALNKKIAIIIGKKFASGSYKLVSDAYVLNTMQNIVSVKIENERRIIKRTIGEVLLLEKMIKTNQDLIPPFEWIVKEKNKLIMFQSKLDGDGTDLVNAKPWQLLLMFKTVARGLMKLHEANYVHSDFKPENILYKGEVGVDRPLICKIGDLGLTLKSGEEILGGSTIHLPPEVLDRSADGIVNVKGVLDPKFDSFSLGVSIFRLLSVSEKPMDYISYPAFMKEDELYKKIDRMRNLYIKVENLYPFEKIIISELFELSKKLMSHDKDKRLSCKEAYLELQKIEAL